MKMTTHSGKVLTIFLVIIAVLLITLTALSMFFYNVEIDKRKGAEGAIALLEKDLEQARLQLKDFQKKSSILAEKNKESDNRVNSLMDELDLEKGLREELKKESVALKEKLQSIQQKTTKLEDKSATQIGDLEQQVVELEAKLKVELNRNKDLEKKNKDLMASQEELKKKAAAPRTAQPATPRRNRDQQSSRTSPSEKTNANAKKSAETKVAQSKANPKKASSQKAELQAKATKKSTNKAQPKSKSSQANSQMNIELDQIVVTPDVRVTEEELLQEITGETSTTSASSGSIPEGRILSVDIETAFVVVNLGRKHGISNGTFMAVYRGNDYLGDIQITRTQEEMAAADLVPPLSGKTLRKNDQVIAK